LVFYLTPALLFAKKSGVLNLAAKITSIVIVVSPLNALIKNQINRLSLHGIEAAALDVKCSTSSSSRDFISEGDEAGDAHSEDETEDFCDFQLGDKEKFEKGDYNIVFAHPEFLVSSTYGRKLMQSKPYQENVCAVVIDEAHCILEW
jgi:superfamily II DNA helicase RecQ